MKKQLSVCILILFCLFNILSSTSSGQSIALKDSLLNRLTELKKESGVKALIACIRNGEKELLTVALGESMTSIPANADMQLRIGGVSETFLGTLLMILVDQGQVRLDDRISKWIPEFLSADKVTLAMLIKNTAGYKDYVMNKEFTELITKEPFRNISREEIFNFAVAGGELNFLPGTEQRYSHTEFTILGEVLERATGKKMNQLYEENIFKPLGLKHTGYCINSDLPSPVLHAFSSDRGIYEDATFWNPSWTGDSGPLFSNLHDLCNWAKVFGKGKLLSPGSFKELTDRPEAAANPDLYFASGFLVSNGWYAQNPSFNGYSGAFGYLPSKELTIVVYTTQSENYKSEAQAFQIFKEIVKIVSPDNQINF